MKKIIDYLFYKYYWFQHKLGNSDVAPFMTVLMITFFSFLFLSGLISFSLFFIFTEDNPILINPYYALYLIGLIFIILYFFYLYESKYIKLINSNNYKTNSNLLSIIFPIISIILLFLNVYIKMLQNQGRI
jgi:hypothetical protein